MKIAYYSLEHDKFLVVDADPFAPLLDWSDYENDLPVDVDVPFVFSTDSDDDLLEATQWASSIAEEDVIGFSELPQFPDGGLSRRFIVGKEAFAFQYRDRMDD